MAAQRQLVDAVEQDREAVGGADGGEEGVEAGLDRVLAQQRLRGLLVGADPKLLVRAVEQSLGALAQARAGGARAGEHEHVLGRRAGGGERLEPPRQRLAASRARRAEDEQRALAVRGDRALRIGGTVAGRRHLSMSSMARMARDQQAAGLPIEAWLDACRRMVDAQREVFARTADDQRADRVRRGSARVATARW